jgi:hypothetical protein
MTPPVVRYRVDIRAVGEGELMHQELFCAPGDKAAFDSAAGLIGDQLTGRDRYAEVLADRGDGFARVMYPFPLHRRLLMAMASAGRQLPRAIRERRQP